MKTLWFVSVFAFTFSSCNNFVCNYTQTQINSDLKAISGVLDSLDVIKFKTRISFRKTELSGILIFKKLNDSTSAGSFINEFGLKGFDFSVNEKRASVGYIFSYLNKSYIRRTLETDLHFMLSKPKLLTTCLLNNNPVSVASVSSSVHYVYYVTENRYLERADLYKRARKISSLQQSCNELTGIVLKMEHKNGSLSYELSELRE
jgi:hypothetical protein